MKPPTDLAGYDPTRDADGFKWDGEAAQKVVDFFSEYLLLTADTSFRTAGTPFKLEKWQADFVATLYGWKRPNGKRRYREALFAVPRKNGKTETGSGLAIYGLCCDSEQKAEIYSAAFSREQASRVFDPAAIMVRNSDALNSRLRIIDSSKRIVYGARNSYYSALSAEASSSHGKNPHLVLFDELHTQKNRLLYDGLKSGRGARTQPLFVNMTTAGFDRHSICFEVWKFAREVRDGINKDPTFLPMVYEIKEGEDWADEEVWKRCNPNLGVTISIEFLREEFARAQATPAYENTFRNLYLNQWTEQAVRWFSMAKWDECYADLGAMYGAECYAGLDLSSTTDLTAFALVIPIGGKYAVKCWFWVPEESARERERRDRVPYSQWIKEGWITPTPGASIDFDRVRADINKIGEDYNIKHIAVDRWGAPQLATQLEHDGYAINYFGQGFASMSAPSKMLEGLVADTNLVHDGNPVLKWMAANVARETDAAENIKPSKKVSTERIDGIVATIMALGVMAANESAVWSTADHGL